MLCMHPFCPLRQPSGAWIDVVAEPTLNLQPGDRSTIAADLTARFGPLTSPGIAQKPLGLSRGKLKTLLKLCPCLFNQIDIAVTARGIVHLCEVTLGSPITSANVHDAFFVQHPKTGPPFKFPPLKTAGSGGTIMEILCSEVLASAGLPAMALESNGWPVWQMPGHILLNEGKMAALQALGDILVPCAPTNIVISVKSEVARERLLYSANSIEGVGFGFFKEPNEFWTSSRMALYKRMGFSAIYMPGETHDAVMNHLNENNTQKHAVNINGTDLYRPLTQFGEDMARIVGRSSTGL